MTVLSPSLARHLRGELKKATKIWVAVGLLNSKGLQFILDSVPEATGLNFIIGIDLPTDPKALSKLLSLRSERVVVVRMLTESFFHPKVYIIQAPEGLTAFVGSANCTTGGLEDNVEMSLLTRDDWVCKELLHWFREVLVPASQGLTQRFIKNYEPTYEGRIKRRKEDKGEIATLIKKEKENQLASLRERKQFITDIKRIRNLPKYPELQTESRDTIRELRQFLDYPRFLNLNLSGFFSIKRFGTIVPIMVKGSIERNRAKFAKLMEFVCNDELPITERMDQALQGKISVPSVGRGFISKVLLIHNPREYFLYNDLFKDWLEPFGLEVPRGMSFGEKYTAIRDILRGILKEVGIENFAMLDQCLWEMHKK